MGEGGLSRYIQVFPPGVHWHNIFLLFPYLFSSNHPFIRSRLWDQYELVVRIIIANSQRLVVVLSHSTHLTRIYLASTMRRSQQLSLCRTGRGRPTRMLSYYMDPSGPEIQKERSNYHGSGDWCLRLSLCTPSGACQIRRRSIVLVAMALDVESCRCSCRGYCCRGDAMCVDRTLMLGWSLCGTAAEWWCHVCWQNADVAVSYTHLTLPTNREV